MIREINLKLRLPCHCTFVTPLNTRQTTRVPFEAVRSPATKYTLDLSSRILCLEADRVRSHCLPAALSTLLQHAPSNLLCDFWCTNTVSTFVSPLSTRHTYDARPVFFRSFACNKVYTRFELADLLSQSRPRSLTLRSSCSGQSFICSLVSSYNSDCSCPYTTRYAPRFICVNRRSCAYNEVYIRLST